MEEQVQLRNDAPSGSSSARTSRNYDRMMSLESNFGDPRPYKSGTMAAAKPGEIVLKILFSKFASLAEKKIDHVLKTEPLEKPLSKSMQRGEDAIFDRLLVAFGSVAEHCLPSILRTLIAWYERQTSVTSGLIDQRASFKLMHASDSQSKASGKNTAEALKDLDRQFLIEKRDLAIEFIFCLVLIEVLKQLSLHPGHEELTGYIENVAFKHFKFRERSHIDPNLQNIDIVADLYAEVIGVMVQSRFTSIKKRFVSELKELRTREQLVSPSTSSASSATTTQNIISLLMGMKFFRIKMVPIEDFEASFTFMNECALYFLEVKDKDIKHALAGLFVEILVPVAAVVKNEVNVPCLRNFVEMMYNPTYELCNKKKHQLALFPLATCLLCVSQKSFFLQNWYYFLVQCLNNLKNRDPKMSRVALESLYRLLWVYMIRIKCESNLVTQSRLQAIVNSLFPKGSKAIVPRDTPLNIFVKIIQFMAQEKLDFAMKEIIQDLLSVGRPIKIIMTPERMSIGLRAFLVIADSLEQKDGEPPMPRSLGPLPSGNTMRVKKTFLNKMLTDETARSIGIHQYYPSVRRALNDILISLDSQLGRPLMLTVITNIHKEADDMMTGERRPKMDLFRTCIAAIPRLIPDGMSRQDLVDLLSRLTLHMDEEMRLLAFQSLQNIINDFPDWRDDVTSGFVMFMLQEISDSFPEQLDNALGRLLKLLTAWKNSIQNSTSCKSKVPPLDSTLDQQALENTNYVLNRVEGMALVMLCHGRQPCRRLAAYILNEVRNLTHLLPLSKNDEPIADVIDRMCPTVIESCMQYIPVGDRSAIALSCVNVNLLWLAERSGRAWIWTGAEPDSLASGFQEDVYRINAWSCCLMEFVSEVERSCPSASRYAWSVVVQRYNFLFSQLESANVLENRASALIRGSSSLPKMTSAERDVAIKLWKSYLMFSCRIAPSSYYLPQQQTKSNFQNDSSSSPDSSVGSVVEQKTLHADNGNHRASQLMRCISPHTVFKQTLPLLRSEQDDIRSAAILGLSFVNSLAIKDLMDELIPYIKEAVDRKTENVRRRNRRHLFRSQLGRLLELIASRGTFGSNMSVLDRESGSLTSILVEYIDGTRFYLESEMDKDMNPHVFEIKQTYCNFIAKLIESFKKEDRGNLLERELRKNLFFMFSNWAGVYGKCLFTKKHQPFNEDDLIPTSFEICALKAMCSVLCCGPVFDPILLSEDSTLYHWLEILIASKDEAIANVGQKTVLYLLEYNPDIGSWFRGLFKTHRTGSGHTRSTSYSVSLSRTIKETSNDESREKRSNSAAGSKGPRFSLGRSRSVQSLKMMDDSIITSPEEKAPLVSQFFWVLIVMLETDDEQEFLLAVRLLEKIFSKFSPDSRNECLDKAANIFHRIKWPNFPGIHTLILKGCTSPVAFEATVILLQKVTPMIDHPLMDPSAAQSRAFPFSVIALLPYMLANFDEPNETCIQAADAFASWSSKKPKLTSLATVMTLYSRRCFSKGTCQWTKAVVKYLYDAFPNVFPSLISFLVEITDKGPSYISCHSISVMYYIFHYIELNSDSIGTTTKSDLNKIVAKYVECSKWKDALKVIQIIVTRSSSLAAAPAATHHASSITLHHQSPAAPPAGCLSASVNLGSIKSGASTFPAPSASYLGASIDCLSVSSGPSFTDSDFGSRRELPGRTMDFDFDVSQTPIVGRRLINPETESNQAMVDSGDCSDPREGTSVEFFLEDDDGIQSVDSERTLKQHGQQSKSALVIRESSERYSDSPEIDDEDIDDGDGLIVSNNWNKPWLSQTRTRDRLISLISNFHSRVKLPKSPSVMFYRTSEPVLGIIESGQPSVASSSEEITAVSTTNDVSEESTLAEATPGAEFSLFKDFDFLEYELESQGSESMDNFNWGVRRRSITNLEEAADDMFSASPCHEGPIETSCSSREHHDLSSDEDPESISPFDSSSQNMTSSGAGHNLSRLESSGLLQAAVTSGTSTTGNRKRPSSVLSCSSIRSEGATVPGGDAEPSLSATNSPLSSSPP